MSYNYKMPLHPLLELILNGFETQALEKYLMLESPTAIDDRWAGYASIACQPLRAKDLLVRAIARGCDVARIELAYLYRVLGEWQQAYREIEALILIFPLEFNKSQSEQNFDRALLLRELAIHQQVLGDDSGALETLDLAWVATLNHSDLAPLKCGIAQSLARIYMDQRQYLKADYYLTVALEDDIIPARMARVLLSRSRCRLFQADFINAQNDLNLVREKLEFIPSLTANTEYVAGMIHRAEQRWDESIMAFELSSVLARRNHDLEVAFHAELCLAACQSTLGQYDQAELHLTRAKKLKTLSERDKAFLEWRSGQVFSTSQPKVALVHLTKAKEAFDNLHMPREFMGVFTYGQCLLAT